MPSSLASSLSWSKWVLYISIFNPLILSFNLSLVHILERLLLKSLLPLILGVLDNQNWFHSSTSNLFFKKKIALNSSFPFPSRSSPTHEYSSNKSSISSNIWISPSWVPIISGKWSFISFVILKHLWLHSLLSCALKSYFKLNVITFKFLIIISLINKLIKPIPLYLNLFKISSVLKVRVYLKQSLKQL